MKKRLTRLMLLAVLTMVTVTCGRGNYSDEPPIHLNPNMDSQEKYKAQSESNFFEDGATMRAILEITTIVRHQADNLSAAVALNNVDETTAELYSSLSLGEERVIAAQADVLAWMDPGAELAHEDGACGDGLATEDLHASALAVAVATVPGAALTFLMSHFSNPASRPFRPGSRPRELRCRTAGGRTFGGSPCVASS